MVDKFGELELSCSSETKQCLYYPTIPESTQLTRLSPRVPDYPRSTLRLPNLPNYPNNSCSKHTYIETCTILLS